MGRKKIEYKNVVISASIPEYQKKFLTEHTDFDFSKFIQIHLADYINLFHEVERIKTSFVMNN